MSLGQFHLILCVICALGSLASESWRLRDEGIKLVQKGKIADSLPYFRAAVRIDPKDWRLMNDLGVTEMRAGEHYKAKTRFLEARELDGVDINTIDDNLDELKEVLGEDEFFAPQPKDRNIEHHIEPIPRVNIKDLYLPENLAYFYLQKPFILTGAMDGWDLSSWLPENLAHDFPHARIDFYPHNMLKPDVHPFIVSFGEAVEYLYRPSRVWSQVDASKPGTYLQWNVQYPDWMQLKEGRGVKDLPDIFDADDVWIDRCFPGLTLRSEFCYKTHWKMVLVGEEGAGMFHHMDTLMTSSWQAQVVGAKRWHLCPPKYGDRGTTVNNNTKNNAKKSKKSGENNPRSSTNGIKNSGYSEQEEVREGEDEEEEEEEEDGSVAGSLYGAGLYDIFHPDYEQFPRLRNIRCYEGVVNTGEMIYYPHGTWHQTYNLRTPTVSVSASAVTEDNYRLVENELEKECRGEQKIYVASPELCSALDACYSRWDVMFNASLHTDTQCPGLEPPPPISL